MNRKKKSRAAKRARRQSAPRAHRKTRTRVKAASTQARGTMVRAVSTTPKLVEVRAAVRKALKEMAPGVEAGRRKSNKVKRSRAATRAFLWLLQNDLHRPAKVSVDYFVIDEGLVFFNYSKPGHPHVNSIPDDRPLLAMSINDLIDDQGRVHPSEVDRAAVFLVAMYEGALPLPKWPPKS